MAYINTVNNTPYKTSSGTITHIDTWSPTAFGLRQAPAATSTPLTLKGAAAQSANLMDVRNSSDTLLGSIDKDSKINMVGYSVGGTPGVSGTFTTADSKTVTVTNGIITAIV
jgi:hypothetical protein